MRYNSILVLFLLLFTGCSIFHWHPFGTPLTREAKAQANQAQARVNVLGKVQELVHETGEVLEVAPDSPAVLEARDFNADAQALIDQSQGAPSAGDVAKWRDLALGLLSADAGERKAAQLERARQRDQIGQVSSRLVDTSVKLAKSEAKVAAYAADNERLADWIRRALWVGGAIVVFIFLGNILAFAAKFYPPLAVASHVVNGLATPLHTLLHTSLVRVERGVAAAKTP